MPVREVVDVVANKLFDHLDDRRAEELFVLTIRWVGICDTFLRNTGCTGPQSKVGGRFCY